MFKTSTNKKKVALLIGINYTDADEEDSNSQLSGCINDIENVQHTLVNNFNYHSENITMLRDDTNDPKYRPTGMNIYRTLHRLVENSHFFGEIWLHYSGHGISINDNDNDERDGMDEAIVPCDYKTSGIITDDMFFSLLQHVRCPVFIVMDCCHSGTICDLPFSFYPSNTDKNAFIRYSNDTRNIQNKNIFMLSGCRDSQTSADAYFNNKSQYGGAFTNAFLDILTIHDYSIHILDLYINVLKYLKKYNFSQRTTLSSSNPKPLLYISPKKMKRGGEKKTVFGKKTKYTFQDLEWDA